MSKARWTEDRHVGTGSRVLDAAVLCPSSHTVNTPYVLPHGTPQHPAQPPAPTLAPDPAPAMLAWSDPVFSQGNEEEEEGRLH